MQLLMEAAGKIPSWSVTFGAISIEKKFSAGQLFFEFMIPNEYILF